MLIFIFSILTSNEPLLVVLLFGYVQRPLLHDLLFVTGAKLYLLNKDIDDACSSKSIMTKL